MGKVYGRREELDFQSFTRLLNRLNAVVTRPCQKFLLLLRHSISPEMCLSEE